MIRTFGNLMNAEYQIIGHQTNCLGIMGGGVAKCIKEKYPEVYDNYKKYCEENVGNCLGKCDIEETHDDKIIMNFFGQEGISYGRNTDYIALKMAIKDGIRQLRKNYMTSTNLQISIAIPYKMGAGLGGGNWDTIVSILEDIEKTMNVIFIAYDLGV